MNNTTTDATNKNTAISTAEMPETPAPAPTTKPEQSQPAK